MHKNRLEDLKARRQAVGQYWIPINLTKKEFINPLGLSSGMKLWEQVANAPGVGAALVVLTAAMPEQRGGGDLDLEGDREVNPRDYTGYKDPENYSEIAKRTIGRWAGDRIAIVGDYAEDTDLPAKFHASTLYSKCSELPILHKGELIANEFLPPKYLDISEDVRTVICHELGGRYDSTYGYDEFTRERPTFLGIMREFEELISLAGDHGKRAFPHLDMLRKILAIEVTDQL